MRSDGAKPARSRIGGAVVTYFPDAEFATRLAAIARECSPVIVVDNSADENVRAGLRPICAIHGTRLIENAENAGIGRALNQAFAVLAAEGLEWVAAFDQDSTPEPGFAAALAAVAESDPRIAVVGANWIDEGRGDAASRHLRRHRRFPLLFERPPAGDDLGGVTCVITSGSLFRTTEWQRLGGFDESLFLDLVDTEYCLRARRTGCDVHVASRARLNHRRGSKRPVRFLGRTWWPAFMPPLRLRYLFRNRLHVARRHGWHNPHWITFELVYTAKILAEIVCLETGKLPKLAACLRGTWDGLLNRRGALIPPMR
jgi:rhamnosyltransferase